MPGFDGTGPMGQGPMTGGGRGFCVMPVSGLMPRFSRRNFCGRRFGRGYRSRYWPAGLTGAQNGEYLGAEPDLKQQLSNLIEEARLLNEQLEDMCKRIEASGKPQDK